MPKLLIAVLLLAGSLLAQLPKDKFDELREYVASLPLASNDKARILKLASESIFEGQTKVIQGAGRTYDHLHPTDPSAPLQQNGSLFRSLREQRPPQPHMPERPADPSPHAFNDMFQRYMDSQREQRQFNQEMMLQHQSNPQLWNSQWNQHWQQQGLANSPNHLNNNLMNWSSHPQPMIIPAPVPTDAPAWGSRALRLRLMRWETTSSRALSEAPGGGNAGSGYPARVRGAKKAQKIEGAAMPFVRINAQPQGPHERTGGAQVVWRSR